MCRGRQIRDPTEQYVLHIVTEYFGVSSRVITFGQTVIEYNGSQKYKATS